MAHDASPLIAATTADGWLLVLALVVPVLGALLAFVAGGRNTTRIALATFPLGAAVALAIAAAVARSRGPLVYLLGDWSPPLGVALRADGPSAVMMAITGVVMCGIALFARADFRTPADAAETRAPFVFWILLLGIWAGLNTVFLSGDLFTLYVALELLTFAAVPVVSLDGSAETLRAALRYLLFALIGSLLYLIGVALVYGAYGTLDLVLLSQRVQADPTTLVALALMSVGLLAKTALFPLHLWLPPAHAGAPPAGSAVLSALVVKGSFFIVVRLWFDTMPSLPGRTAGQILGALGATAIVAGSVIALRQERLKLMIAYSTLAQIGYLFLMFPLAFAAGADALHGGAALAGGILQAISHATAKAAMFLVAGSLYAAYGHDRLAELGGIARVRPVSVLAFALAGLALIGLPPSGAYVAKALLLGAASAGGQWWWEVVLDVGGLCTAGYVALVLAHTLAPRAASAAPRDRVRGSRVSELTTLALALCSLLLGLIDWGALLGAARAQTPAAITADAIVKSMWPILGGCLLAFLLARAEPRAARNRGLASAGAAIAPLRRGAVAMADLLVRADGVLRQWTAAGLSVLVLIVVLCVAMLGAR